jgi:peptidyl-prolyl cis-trans isomerase SurA
MKKLIAAGMVLFSFSAPAQTLFTYGKDSVSVKDFVHAFRKNNPTSKSEASFKEYLNLYIASRLKIKEAVANGYDTLPQFVAELENLRAQIMPGYLNDKSAVDKLVNEAFTRSQKDIQLAHIYISFPRNVSYDTTAARNKAEEAVKQISSGKAFSDVAKQYSDDPAAKTTGGNLGWITVFNLPYELENLAYATPAGKTSNIYKSKAGYHIFKNVAERKALGRMKAAQILVAFPPEADAPAKERVKLLADSIYNRLQKGDDFAKLATEFSNDVVSAASGGVMQEFGVGEYDPLFEQNVFALTKDNDITKPFLTAHGYHIAKRISRNPISATKDERTTQSLKTRVESSDRIQWAQKAFTQKVLKDAGYKKASYTEKELWMYSDSVLNRTQNSKPVYLNATSALFKLGKKDVTAQDWTNYAMVYRYKQDGSLMIKFGVSFWKERQWIIIKHI